MKTPYISIPTPFPNFVQCPQPPALILLLCCFGWMCGPKLFEPWYCNTSSTLCALCNRASNLLKVWHGWHFLHFWQFLLVLWFEITHANTHRTQMDQYTDAYLQIYINTNCYIHTVATCITLNKYITDTKTYFTEVYNVSAFQNYSHVEVIYLLIRFHKLSPFSETQRILRGMV